VRYVELLEGTPGYRYEVKKKRKKRSKKSAEKKEACDIHQKRSRLDFRNIRGEAEEETTNRSTLPYIEKMRKKREGKGGWKKKSLGLIMGRWQL